MLAVTRPAGWRAGSSAPPGRSRSARASWPRRFGGDRAGPGGGVRLAAITLLIGLPLTYVYGGVATFGYLAGIGGLPVVLIYLTVNIAVIRAFRTEYRDEFRLVPHLLIPAAASVVFLFPLWGILFPGAYTLANLLPFISLGWLLIGAIAAGILRARRPATFQALGRAVAPNLDKQLELD